MTCPAQIDSKVMVAYCNRVDAHPDGIHVASLGDDYLAIGIALEVWDDTGRRYLPQDPEHRQAITSARTERAGHRLEEIR